MVDASDDLTSADEGFSEAYWTGLLPRRQL